MSKPSRPLTKRATGRSVAEGRRIEIGELVDLPVVELRRDAPHPGIDVVTPVAAPVGFQLPRQVLPVLVRQRRGLDGSAGIEAVARVAGREATRRIPPLHEPDDVLV